MAMFRLSPPRQPVKKVTARMALQTRESECERRMGKIIFLQTYRFFGLWLFKCSLVRLEIDLMHLVFPDEILMDIVEDAVDELPTLGGAVILGQIDIFIDGHFRGDRLEVEKFND